MAVNYIPKSYNNVTQYFMVAEIDAFIKFLEDVFGATVKLSMKNEDGSTGHTEMKIGNSLLMMGGTCDKSSPTSAYSYVYVPDADAVFAKGLKAGATETQKLENMFWGDRLGNFKDPFGNSWTVATRKEIVTPEEIERRLRVKAAKGS